MSQPFLTSRCFAKLRHLGLTPEINTTRKISTSCVNNGKKNFRHFNLGNKRGTKLFKKQRNAGMFPDIPIQTSVRPTGYLYGDRWVEVPEMIPEFIVPDLTGFELKPYVSYRTPKIVEDPFTAKDLFDAVYSTKIAEDFKNGKILEDGRAVEESDNEKLTAEEAFTQARMTGSDLFEERKPKIWEFLDNDLPGIT